MKKYDKISTMKQALDSESIILTFKGQHTAANAVKDFLWSCDDTSLVRLFDTIKGN